MTTQISRDEILRRRIHSQLAGGADLNSGEVVRHLFAIQAQDFAQSLWAVGLRARGSTRSDVLAALDAGSVVRTHPMRGTLHLVAAEDLRWMLDVTSTRTLASAATRFRELGLDDATLERSADVVREELGRAGTGGDGTIGAGRAGARRLDRAGLMALLESNGISTAGQRGYHIIFSLSQRAIVCWGPAANTQQSLVLVDEWIAPSPPVAREEALREFAIRYFRGHGPATVRDFAWWTKLTLTDARAGVAGAADELTEVESDGVSYLASPRQLDDPAPRFSRGVLLLPGFDEFLLGYENRSATLEPEHFERIVPGSNGIFYPTIVSRGRVVGTWSRMQKSREAGIEPEFFAKPTAPSVFASAAGRYSRFMRG